MTLDSFSELSTALLEEPGDHQPDSAAVEPELGTHKPEFLWNPTRTELITTKFMRNHVLFSTLAHELLPRLRKQKGSPLKILFWACSIGCEPYTLKFLLGPDSTDVILGIDQDADAVRHARLSTYDPATWTMFFDSKKSLLTDEEISRYFESPDEATPQRFRVAGAYRQNMFFLMGNLFAAEPAVPLRSFDLVVCNNLLIHLKPRSADLAWDYLYRYLHEDGLIAVGGCNPLIRLKAAKRLELQPCPESLAVINRSWCGVTGAWNFNPRPAWAYPDPDESDPDFNFLAGEIMRKSPHV